VVKKFPRTALLLSLGLLLSNTSTIHANEQTTVYKVIGKDGSISFSDKAQKGSEEIKVKPVATVPAMDIKQNKSLSNEDNQTAEYYQALSIISPANNTAFNTGSGNVQVVVQAKPGLRNGDAFELELDGRLVSTQRGTTFNLESVDRGTHTLSVKIINRNKQTLKAAISTITIHRPISRPARTQPVP
jgi:hypothetical protein